MKIKQLIDEDFTNYKKTSMFLSTSMCDGKCWTELGLEANTCHNSALYNEPAMTIADCELAERYKNNPITEAIVIGGLEPFFDPNEIIEFIDIIRVVYDITDDIVIYTGYYDNECKDTLEKLKLYENIIVKFGRFIPNDNPHFDEVLGITLASSNQYAEKIS